MDNVLASTSTSASFIRLHSGPQFWGGRLDAGLIGLTASGSDPDLEFATVATESLLAAIPAKVSPARTV